MENVYPLLMLVVVVHVVVGSSGGGGVVVGVLRAIAILFLPSFLPSVRLYVCTYRVRRGGAVLG